MRRSYSRRTFSFSRAALSFSNANRSLSNAALIGVDGKLKMRRKFKIYKGELSQKCNVKGKREAVLVRLIECGVPVSVEAVAVFVHDSTLVFKALALKRHLALTTLQLIHLSRNEN